VTRKGETKLLLEKSLPKAEERLQLEASELRQSLEFTISLVSTARAPEGPRRDQAVISYLNTESDPVRVCYVLSPPPPTDLKLEAATTSSLKIKWEHPPEQTKLFYTVSIKVWVTLCASRNT
jgi:hypothetical protein